MKAYTWYKQESSIDSPETVHQILVYGTLRDIKELKNQIGQEKLIKYFIEHPQKKYTPPAFNFIKNIVLNIREPLNESKYLKDTPRDIRPR